MVVGMRICAVELLVRLTVDRNYCLAVPLRCGLVGLRNTSTQAKVCRNNQLGCRVSLFSSFEMPFVRIEKTLLNSFAVLVHVPEETLPKPHSRFGHLAPP